MHCLQPGTHIVDVTDPTAFSFRWHPRDGRLAAFCGHHGADFYGIPRNEETVTVAKQAWKVPASYTFGQTKVVPLRAGEEISWTIVSEGRGPLADE